VGDLIWLAADARTKGFLVGGTSGRTTLNGEGLQHQDGHSHLIASSVPTIAAYDPAYAYELAVIIQDGMRRMYHENEDIFYYLSVYNENYEMPPMPDGVQEGILRGMYKLSSVEGEAVGKEGAGKDGSGKDGSGKDGAKKEPKFRPQIFGSGPILRAALGAQKLLAEKYGVGSDVWSVTSYNELRRGALEAEHWNRLHPGETPKKSFLEQTLEGLPGPFVAASDNVKLVADQIRNWMPAGSTYVALGTDGFGRSETRESLRSHFEIDAEATAYAALWALSRHCHFDKARLPQVIRELGIDPEKVYAGTA
jgi:pyruvate dehydrogenase E1 component